MKKQYRFLISYFCNNQPNTIEISCDKDSLDQNEAEKYIQLANTAKAGAISDIQVISLHQPNNFHVHSGHYQQPER